MFWFLSTQNERGTFRNAVRSPTHVKFNSLLRGIVLQMWSPLNIATVDIGAFDDTKRMTAFLPNFQAPLSVAHDVSGNERVQDSDDGIKPCTTGTPVEENDIGETATMTLPAGDDSLVTICPTPAETDEL